MAAWRAMSLFSIHRQKMPACRVSGSRIGAFALRSCACLSTITRREVASPKGLTAGRASVAQHAKIQKSDADKPGNPDGGDHEVDCETRRRRRGNNAGCDEKNDQ